MNQNGIETILTFSRPDENSMGMSFPILILLLAHIMDIESVVIVQISKFQIVMKINVLRAENMNPRGRLCVCG